MTHCNLIWNSDVRIIVSLCQYIINKHNSEIFGIARYNLTTKEKKEGNQIQGITTRNNLETTACVTTNLKLSRHRYSSRKIVFYSIHLLI